MTKLDEQIANVNKQIEQLNKKRKSLLSKHSEEKRAATEGRPYRIYAMM